MSKKSVAQILYMIKNNQVLAKGIKDPLPSECNRIIKRKLSYKRKEANRGLFESVIKDAKVLIKGSPFGVFGKSVKKLMNKDLQNVASQFAKIIESGHPVVNTAKNVLKNADSSSIRKQVVLSLSDILNETSKENFVDDINSKNSSLAELTELLHVAFLVQRGLINMLQLNVPDNLLPDFELGNKLSVLGGDYLLAKVTVMLSQLENSIVLGLMAGAVRDMSSGVFTLPEQREHLDEHLISNIPASVQDWTHQNSLAYGSLLANACRSGAVLHNQDEEYGDACSKFGHHLTLAQEARLDINRILKDKNSQIDISSTEFFSDLCSLPSAVASEQQEDNQWIRKFLVREKSFEKRPMFSLSREQFRSTLCNNNIVNENCEKVCREHVDLAMDALHKFPESKNRKKLENITISCLH